MESTKYAATPQDRMNYILGHFSANQQINAVLFLNYHISKELLKESVLVTMEIEPVLKCRFVVDDIPYWEEHPSPSSLPVTFFKEGQDQDIEKMAIEFIEEPGNFIKDPMVQMKLLRGNTRDILVIKLSHLCTDGAGVKAYMNMLGNVYTRLSLGQLKDEIIKGYHKSGERDQSLVFHHAGITDIKSAYQPNHEPKASLWSFPSRLNGNEFPKMSVRRLTREQTQRLTQWAKVHQATINDVIMTAYFRALSRVAVYAEPRTTEKMIGLTIDLRRCLPEDAVSPICNLSGMEMPEIKLEADEDFLQTLDRVKKSMKKIKSQNPGLSSAAGMELLAGMKLSAVKDMYKQQHEQALHTGMALPLLTNFGVVTGEPITFGGIQAEDGYITSPVMYAPFFTLGASSYNGRLTFTIGYHTPGTAEENVNLFLDRIVNQLLDQCNQLNVN
ncbi:condensation protein [Bacillus sp. V3]|nr:condensation protein [Bacillus sp. V3]